MDNLHLAMVEDYLRLAEGLELAGLWVRALTTRSPPAQRECKTKVQVINIPWRHGREGGAEEWSDGSRGR